MKIRRISGRVGMILVSMVILAGLASTLLPDPTNSNNGAALVRTIVAFLAASFTTFGAVQLLNGIAVFKDDLKVAYRFIAAGFIALAFAIIQLPIVGLFDWWMIGWVTSGGVILPFVGASVILYVGLRKFANLLQVFVQPFWQTVALATIASLLSYLLARTLANSNFEDVESYIAIIVWGGTFIAASALLARAITRNIGREYTSALQILTVAVTALLLSSLHEAVTSFFVNNGEPFIEYGFYLLPFVITGVLISAAGQVFWNLAYDSVVDTDPGKIDDSDYIDSITTIAVLASRPQDIDYILDDMRQITATLEPERKLSPSQKQRLLKVYIAVEHYLIHQDPMRSFTRDQLRRRVLPAYRTLLKEHGSKSTS